MAAWLDAVAAADVDRIERLVEPVGLAVVAAVENNLRSDELAGLLADGFSPDLAAEYWAGFRDDFGAIRGSSLSELEIGNEISIPDTSEYAAVEIAAGETTGRVILRSTEQGWQVDFAATVGPALVGPLGEYLEGALTGEHATPIGDAYRFAVVPALAAAATLDQENSVLVFETEYIRQLVSR